jgi:tetratricopeptide (TPR) repeat protein
MTDERAAVLETMQQLAKDQDYKAILEMNHLGSNDPETTSIVADAKQHFIAHQARLIESENAAGRCARSHELATAAVALVPDETSLAAKANACKAHVGELPYDPAADLRAAGAASARGDFGTALALAEKVLAKQPSNEDALKAATLASCDSKNAQKARLYYLQLNGPDRSYALGACKKDGVTPTGEAETPPFPTALDIKEQLAAASKALKDNDPATALQVAEKVTHAAPHNELAFEILGRAACRLNNPQKAKSALKHLKGRRADAVLTVCARQNVPLD